ncbi:DUF2846 domain-containing protein [Cobetia amphilecti]|uniref:DUF2846 domain-containing protein n=1 Tax=Cobetia amphilecti TaxID=1055104 RepID=UPI001C08A00E|nr:DUF2846 domain-containing protein [Cobetia amphilecti]MBU3008624.1 DUF2846 domain-containing protein [Cobetia amphilecti]
MQLYKLSSAVFLFSVMTGCASVNMASQQESIEAKAFDAPDQNMAGIYIYRSNSMYAASLKKDIWIQGECVGESARGVFFYEQVPGGKSYEIATESGFSPNTLTINVESGVNYYIEQYMKYGLFVAGANLRLVGSEEGMAEISDLDMAVKGNCS